MPIELKPIEVPRILDLNSQVLPRKDWIPQGLFAELDKLRDEHHERVAELENAGHVSARLRARYEHEDRAREAAAAAGEELPPMTGSAERKDRLEEARVLVQARVDQLAAFVERAIEVINEKGPTEWRAEFDSQLVEADQEVAAAREVLRAAEGKEARIKGNENWVNQTMRAWGGMYLAASQFPATMTREEWAVNKVSPALSGAVVEV